MPLGWVTTRELDEERNRRIEAEKQRDVAQRLAEERLVAINDWRRMHEANIKVCEAERLAHAAEVQRLREAKAPPPRVDPQPPPTAQDVMNTPVSTKRAMRERRQLADTLRAREMSEEDKALLAARQKRIDDEMDRQAREFAKYDIDPSFGAAFLRPEPETDAAN